MAFDMERRRSMCFEHSDEEDEDHMRRISMCFSIDISDRVKKQNRFHNQVSTTARRSRNPGGGIFGTDPQRSFVSLTIPNKFYADSRADSNTIRPRETRRHSYDYDNNWSREQYVPNRYHRYNNERHYSLPQRRKAIETYDYPRPLKYHRPQRNYSSSGYQEYVEPRSRNYYQREYEPVPEFVLKRKKRGQYFKDSYNCDYPAKFSHSENNNFPLSTYNEQIKNSHRRKSGYSGRDYEPYYETNPISIPKYDYYNNQPTKRQYDSDYYESSPMYPFRKKSVDFFGQDCEIPYNILKRPRHIERKYNYADSQSCLRLSAVDIPYKRKRQKPHRYKIELEPEPKRSESGSDICRPRKRCIENNFPRSFRKPTRGFNPLTRSSQKLMQESALCCKKSRRSLKEKISDFFKKSKCKSRTKCSKNYRTKMRRSISCLDNSKSDSSISCIVVQNKRPVCRPVIKRTKCITYPTVYRDKCPSCVDPDEECDAELLACPSLRMKVNCCQSTDCGNSKCCCESCRTFEPNTKLTVEAPSYCSFPTEDQKSCCCGLKKTPRSSGKTGCRYSGSIDDFPFPRKTCSCFVCASKIESPRKGCCGASQAASCFKEDIESSIRTCDLQKECSQSFTLEEDCFSEENISCPRKASKTDCAERKESSKKTCCSASCPSELLSNPIKQSTINVCLKICTTDGKILEPPRIITTIEPESKTCILTSPCTSKIPSVCPSETATCCPTTNSKMSVKKRKSTCCLNATGSKNSLLSETCTENNYTNVRNASNASCIAPKVPKPILTKSKKSSCKYCSPLKTKSVEIIDWNKCPSKVKISQSAISCGRKNNTEQNRCHNSIAEKCTTQECSNKDVREKKSCCLFKKESSTKQDCCCIRKDDSTQSTSCVRKSSSHCKKTTPKVEFACTTPTPLECHNRPSIVEELKRELLETLRSEQKLCCQQPYQKPKPHIMIYPCAPEETTSQPCANKCWRPL